MGNVIIIGAGPAGVSASLYTIRAGVKTTVLGRDGGALAKAEKIQNYYGLPEAVSGRQLQEDGVAGARKLGVEFVDTEVVGLRMNDSFDGFVVESLDGVREADAVILAGGASRLAPPIPGLKELEGRGVSYCAVCDAFFYRGKTVAVLGAGEYALHEAETLLPVAGKVYLLTDGAEPEVALPDNLEVRKEKIAALEGGDRLASARLENGDLVEIDGAFVAYGTAGSVDLARKIGALVQNGSITVNKDMATNVPGLYAAGDCTGGLLQIVKAAYEGAAAGLSVIRYLRGKEKR